MLFASLKNVLLVAAVSAAPSTSVSPITSCGSGYPKTITIRDISVSPLPLVLTEPINARFEFITSQTITSGSLVLEASAFGVSVPPETMDLCRDLGVVCPVPPNTLTRGWILYQVGISPSLAGLVSSVNLKIKVLDGAGAEIECSQVSGVAATTTPSTLPPPTAALPACAAPTPCANVGCSGGHDSASSGYASAVGGGDKFLQRGYDCDGDGLEDPMCKRPWQWCEGNTGCQGGSPQPGDESYEIFMSAERAGDWCVPQRIVTTANMEAACRRLPPPCPSPPPPPPPPPPPSPSPSLSPSPSSPSSSSPSL